MKFLETEHEKRSFVITSIIFGIILLLCFFLGMTYMDPPPENGIAINFGTTEFGSGDIQPDEPIKSAPQQVQSAAQSAPVEDEVSTQDINDAPVVTNKKPQKETPKEAEKPKETPKPTPSKSTSDALNSLINGPKSDGKATGGEGDDDKAGDKGRIDGIKGGAYDGKGGKGTSGTGTGNYRLSGRKNLNTPKPQYKCNEEGTVVVEITVNRAGKVIKVERGRGTTNAAQCLFEQAKAAAFETKFDSSESAPETQIGTIIYNFKLTD